MTGCAQIYVNHISLASHNRLHLTMRKGLGFQTLLVTSGHILRVGGMPKFKPSSRVTRMFSRDEQSIRYRVGLSISLIVED